MWTLNDFPEAQIAIKCEEMGFNKFVSKLRVDEQISDYNYFDGSLDFSFDLSTAIGQTNNNIGKTPLMSFINLTGRAYWHFKFLDLSIGSRVRYGIANQHTSIEEAGVNFRGNYWNIAGSLQKDFETFALTLDYVLSGSYSLSNTDVLGQSVEYTGASGFGISALRPMKLFGMLARIGLSFEVNNYNKKIAGSSESLADQTFSSLGLTIQASF